MNIFFGLSIRGLNMFGLKQQSLSRLLSASKLEINKELFSLV